jgi:UTP--glucose-1-phosphate uridylyltransferase
MLPIGRRPVLVAIADELVAAGVERAVVVLSPAKEALIRAALGSRCAGLAIEYVLQPTMLGLGDAVARAAPALDRDEPVLVALGDAVFEEAQPGAIVARMREAARDAEIVVAVQAVARERLSRYGVVAPSEPILTTMTQPFTIADIVEKPAPDDAPSRFAVAARYALPGGIVSHLATPPDPASGEVRLTDALRQLLRDGVRGRAVPLLPGEVRHDIGSFDSYFQAFASFALADHDLGPTLRRYIEELLRAPAAAGGHLA